MSNKKKVIKPKKALAVRDLKSWLNGILEFQTEEWVPTKEQWLTIKEKIFDLEEGLVAGPANPVYPSPPRPHYDQPMMPHPNAAPLMPAPAAWAGPAIPSGLDMPNDVPHSGQPTQKTANIDTSKNGYNSGFE